MSRLIRKPVRFNGTLFAKTWIAVSAGCILAVFGLFAGMGRALPSVFAPSWSSGVFLTAALLLTTAFLSILATVWIDRPFKKLMAFITEMGRGNFSLRIPEQRNKQMKRLAKLVNYMAEEMDHLQQINVSHIINEKNKTESILRNIADGVLVTDSEDRILVINTTAEKWFGLEEKAVLHKPLGECIRNPSLLVMLKDVRDGKSRASTEFRTRFRNSGAERIFEAHAVQVFGKDSRRIGVVTILRDVTKERDADRIKTELVSMVAHELKSPLTSIYGFSELLLDSKIQPHQMKEYIQVIQSESKRLSDFVNKFLDLSKLESGKMAVKTVPFDFRSVVLQVAESFRGQLDRKAMRLIVEIPDNLQMAFGDQHLVEQVLVNLISNAVKYSPPQSKMGIEVALQNKKIQVDVIDNGYGIPKEDLPHIFEKFYRVPDMEHASEIEGSGLGLTLVKEIVERHSGHIMVKSKLGVGSVFTFSLPVADFALQQENT
jgi:two-component system phosphate regulon sensor histidine kinase PhoR